MHTCVHICIIKATWGQRQEDCSLCTGVCVRETVRQVRGSTLYLHNGSLLYNDSSETGNTRSPLELLDWSLSLSPSFVPPPLPCFSSFLCLPFSFPSTFFFAHCHSPAELMPLILLFCSHSTAVSGFSDKGFSLWYRVKQMKHTHTHAHPFYNAGGYIALTSHLGSQTNLELPEQVHPAGLLDCVLVQVSSCFQQVKRTQLYLYSLCWSLCILEHLQVGVTRSVFTCLNCFSFVLFEPSLLKDQPVSFLSHLQKLLMGRICVCLFINCT